jgi:TolB-like protein
MNLLGELKRRKVLRVAGMYLVGAWLVVQVVETLLPIFETPGWVLKLIVALLAIGFVPAVVAAWVFELTPEGVRRTVDGDTGEAPGADPVARRLDIAVIVLLLATIAFTAWHRAHPPAGMAGAQPAGEPAADAGHAALGPRSVAVLPFENFSAEPADALFASGLADTVLHQLAQVRELRVTARNSSFSYKGQNIDVRKVGEELGVASLLEGSVQRQGNRIRVIAQLVETRGGSHLWSQTYDRPIDDLFAIQDEIAIAVVKALAGELLDGEAAPGRPPPSPEALARLLEARADRDASTASGQRTVESYSRWRDLAMAAVRADPGHVDAWIELADAEQSIAFVELDATSRDAAIRRGYIALRRALALEPDSRPALAVMAWLLLREDRPTESLAVNLSLLERAPNDTGMMRNAGLALMQLGRPTEALVLQERALALDPLSAGGIRQRGGSLMMLGRLDEARANHEDGIRRFPSFSLFHLDLAAVSGNAEGDWPGAVDWLVRGAAAFPDDARFDWTLAYDLALLGLQDAAEHHAAQAAAGADPRAVARSRIRLEALAGRPAQAIALVDAHDLESDARWLAENRAGLALLCWRAADDACTRRHLAAGLEELGGGMGEPFQIVGQREIVEASQLGLVAQRLGDPRGATLLRLALARLRQQPALGPHNWQQVGRLHGEAELLGALGERDAALQALQSGMPDDASRVRLRGIAGTSILDSPFLASFADDPAFREVLATIEQRRAAAARRVRATLESAGAGG